MIKVSSINENINGIAKDDWFYTKLKFNGSMEMNINGSSTNVIFTLEDLPFGQKILLQSINFLIGTGENIDLVKFGNTNLTNGIEFSLGSGAGLISSNADVLLVSTGTTIQSAGVGINLFSVVNGRWDLTEAFGGGSPIMLDKDDFYIKIQDDLSGVPYFEMSVHGILLK